MRVIKLSENFFDSEKSVMSFFKRAKKSDNGKFRITKGRISKKHFQIGEELIFSFRGQILYKAIASSNLLINTDEESSKFPFYFMIDLKSITPLIKMDLHHFEKLFYDLSKIKKSIVQTQGWPIIQDKKIADTLWSKLVSDDTQVN